MQHQYAVIVDAYSVGLQSKAISCRFDTAGGRIKLAPLKKNW
jgi:hypothetical protein